MKHLSAPASIVGTANPFSGEITEALVKSHEHLVGHFFPFPLKWGGGQNKKTVWVGDQKVRDPWDWRMSCVM